MGYGDSPIPLAMDILHHPHLYWHLVVTTKARIVGTRAVRILLDAFFLVFSISISSQCLFTLSHPIVPGISLPIREDLNGKENEKFADIEVCNTSDPREIFIAYKLILW